MSRYNVPRRYIYWNTNELACLKMLSYILRKYEAECRNKYMLWRRVEELCPKILLVALGRATTFKEVRSATLAQTGLQITPDRLYQRSDKTGRYEEFNAYLTAIEAAYFSIVGGGIPSKSDTSRRTFTDAQVKSALERQNGRCYFRGCDCSDGVVGDHLIPFSQNGLTVDWNCVASCVRCNEEKGSMSSFEFGKLIGWQNGRGRQL